jgi:hypothetical protein
MIQNQEKRLNSRCSSQVLTRIEDLRSGFIESVMCNYGKTGSYIETNYNLEVGEDIYIGNLNSPCKPFSTKNNCYLAQIVRKQKALYSRYKYGYGLRYIFANEFHNSKLQKSSSTRGLRKYSRKPISMKTFFLSNKQIVEANVKNISQSGAFIETQKKFSGGEIIKLAIRKKKNQNGKITGEVIWHNYKGIGIQFINALKN